LIHSFLLGRQPQRRLHYYLEQIQSYNSEEYHDTDEALTSFFTVRTGPGPDCWQASDDGVNK
jgi:hypothetical protein